MSGYSSRAGLSVVGAAREGLADGHLGAVEQQVDGVVGDISGLRDLRTSEGTFAQLAHHGLLGGLLLGSLALALGVVVRLRQVLAHPALEPPLELATLVGRAQQDESDDDGDHGVTQEGPQQELADRELLEHGVSVFDAHDRERHDAHGDHGGDGDDRVHDQPRWRQLPEEALPVATLLVLEPERTLERVSEVVRVESEEALRCHPPLEHEHAVQQREQSCEHPVQLHGDAQQRAEDHALAEVALVDRVGREVLLDQGPQELRRRRCEQAGRNRNPLHERCEIVETPELRDGVLLLVDLEADVVRVLLPVGDVTHHPVAGDVDDEADDHRVARTHELDVLLGRAGQGHRVDVTDVVAVRVLVTVLLLDARGDHEEDVGVGVRGLLDLPDHLFRDGPGDRDDRRNFPGGVDLYVQLESLTRRCFCGCGHGVPFSQCDQD